LNRKDEFIKSFVQEAITRVVKPLHLDDLVPEEVLEEGDDLEPLPPLQPNRTSQRAILVPLEEPEPEVDLVELYAELEDDWVHKPSGDWEDD
jgi:hypothetical protein